MSTSGKNRVTYFPLVTQELFKKNRQQIKGLPYEHYFNGDLWLHDEAMESISTAIDPALAIAPDKAGLNSLLEPGYHPAENGFCELPDGSGYVASLVPFPGCTGEMLKWWFWWHSVEPARYTLWYPYNHISATPTDRRLLVAPGLTHEERFIGSTHIVDEYVGADLVKVKISFVDPADLGFDTSLFEASGIVAHACARVMLRINHLEVVTMVHLARQTSDGFELRSRYWFGHDPKLKAFGRSIGVDTIANRLGLKRQMGAVRLAYEQLLHDQIEFSHLSTFLADIYREFS